MAPFVHLKSPGTGVDLCPGQQRTNPIALCSRERSPDQTLCKLFSKFWFGEDGWTLPYLRAGDGNAPLSMQRRKRIHEPDNTAFLLQECRQAIHLRKDQHTRADRQPRRGENSCPKLLAHSTHVYDAAQQQARPFSSCLFSHRPSCSRQFATPIG